MGTPMLEGIRKMAFNSLGDARSYYQGLQNTVGASTQLPPNYLKNSAIVKNMGGLGRFIGKHPKLSLFGGIAALAGGSMLGANMLANQKKGDWYNQGHQAATRTYAPMMAARSLPQGAMSLPAYARS